MRASAPGIEIASEAAPDVREADEAALVAAARRDPRAFAPLYARYLDPVYRYCYLRLGTREAAEDATSQVFLKALAALPSCDERTFPGWLFAIARNVVADAYRARRPERPLAAARAIADGRPPPEEVALAGVETEARWALLNRLPADQRQVIALRLSGLTGDQIARVMGRSLPAVKMLQMRAVRRLRRLAEDAATADGR